LLSLAAWRLEIECVKGWDGLRWLSGYPWAALPICALVATSIVLAIAPSVPLRPVRVGIFLAVATGIAWSSFEIARQWFYDDLAWLSLARWRLPPSHWLFSPLLSTALTALGTYLAVRWLLFRIRPWSIALFALAVLLVLPLSVLSLQVFPAHGYRDAIHAIKAGYPMFWINLLMAAATGLAVRFGERPRR
jgi:hypothetical protein